jgi:membrane protease YdiL (CAAX protease family)
VISSAVQELIVRGALQSSLEMFLTGPRRVKNAILVSGLLFAALHIHIGFVLALVAFVPGLFWGVLYARKRNLIGVTLSHIAVGVYAFFILGTWLP